MCQELKNPQCVLAEVKMLQEQLHQVRLTIQSLMQQLGENPLPFCEDAFVDDEFTKYHTGLPNCKVLLCLFEHVSVGMLHERETKLTLFQQFSCVIEAKDQCRH